MPEKRDERFGAQHRLSRSSDFRRVLTRGKRIATRYFVIYLLPNHLPFSRLGIQVKAQIGTSIRRNYIKRIVREYFRRIKSRFRQPSDLILIAERPMVNLGYRQLVSELESALQNFLQ